MACGTFVSPTALSIGGTVDVDIVAQTLASLTVEQQAPAGGLTAMTVNASGQIVVPSGADIVVAAAFAARRLIVITNTDSTNAVNLAFGVPATATSMIYLAPEGTFVMEVNDYGEMFTGEIHAWGLTANVDLRFVEFGV